MAGSFLPGGHSRLLRSSAEEEMNEWKLWREKDDDCSAAAAADDVAAESGYGYANVGYTIRYDFNIEYINRNRVEQTIYPSIREPDTLTIYLSIYLSAVYRYDDSPSRNAAYWGNKHP